MPIVLPHTHVSHRTCNKQQELRSVITNASIVSLNWLPLSSTHTHTHKQNPTFPFGRLKAALMKWQVFNAVCGQPGQPALGTEPQHNLHTHQRNADGKAFIFSCSHPALLRPLLLKHPLSVLAHHPAHPEHPECFADTLLWPPLNRAQPSPCHLPLPLFFLARAPRRLA